ncbi:MAG: TIGR03767 family metallophosphoesterase [Nitriliruptorales bacterium]
MTSLRHMHPLTRRSFLRRLAVLSAAAWTTPLWTPATRRAMAQTRGTAAHPQGTTLERTIVTTGDGPYFRLAFGPPWPLQVRTDLAEPRPGREARRVALTSFLHVTDFQFPDAQSPARVEFLDRYGDEPTPSFLSSAQRPQEAVTIHACEAIIRQANEVAVGPITGRPLDFTISTGDNFDNKQLNELRWFLTLMDGGTIEPNSGDRNVFESVQTFDDVAHYDPHYYHPEPVGDPLGRTDDYKRTFGFPDYPGLMQAAGAPFTAAGLTTPWYSVYGNHDALVQGNEQPNPFYEAVAVGGTKILHPPPGWAPGDLYRGLVNGDPEAVRAFALAPSRPVAPDPDRRFVSPEEYVRFHLDAPGGPGPAGHGFTEDNLDPVHLYYTFEIIPGVRGITLDTTSPRTSEGSIGDTQLAWLEGRLVEVHSRCFDDAGTEVRTGNDDELVVLFAHHRAASMEPIQGQKEQGELERRHGGDELEALLHRFPNVIAWVNGHSHFNRVEARPDPAGRTGGYWDITTSAQLDPPQQARILELVDNRDGTLSLFTTIIDHAGPPQTAVGAHDVLGLAAISRELAYNDYQSDVSGAIGEPKDLNVELLVTAPFRLESTPPGRIREDRETTVAAVPVLPTTGSGLGAAGAALLGGAIALRGRRPAEAPTAR